MERLQTGSVIIGSICGLLALSTSTGCPLVSPGDPESALAYHPLVFLLGLGCGFLTFVRSRQVDKRMWEVVEDSTLTSGEREIAHRDAGLAKKAVGTMFLVAPLGLGLWLSYQFKAEDMGIAELLTITPLIGFGVGLGVAALRDRGERPGRPPG